MGSGGWVLIPSGGHYSACSREVDWPDEGEESIPGRDQHVQRCGGNSGKAANSSLKVQSLVM